MAAYSPLAQALYALLMETELFTREQWCEFLTGTDKEEIAQQNTAIEEWFTDVDIPEPEQMTTIIHVLRGSSDPDGKIRVALEKFWCVMHMPPQHVSPHIDKIRSRARVPDKFTAAWAAVFTESSAMHGLETILCNVDPSRLDELFALIFQILEDRPYLMQPITGQA